MTAKRGETVESHVLLTTLAGLIHDVGKVCLWAGNDGSLAEHAKAFVGEYGLQLVGETHHEELANAVARIVEGHGDSGLGTPPRAPLLCPVAARLWRIECGEDGRTQTIGPAKGQWAYMPLDLVPAEGGTSLGEAFLPREDLEPSHEAFQQLLEALWESWAKLVGDVGQRRKDGAPLTPHQLIHAVLGLLQRYLWGVPAYAEDGPGDIALLEHLRLAAACEAAKAAQSDNAGGKPYLLVIGDLSGIQDFIYGLQRRGLESQQHLAKRLRGRSFYLSALSRAIGLWLAKECGVSEANVIASAGGNFQLLVPNAPEVVTRLEVGRREINDWLLRTFRGRLAAAIEWVEADDEDLQTPSVLAERAYQGLGERKLHRFSELGVDAIIEDLPQEVSGECRSCGTGLDESNRRTERSGEGGDDIEVIEVCVGCKDHGFVIGDVLPKAQYVAWDLVRDSAHRLVPQSALRCSEANQQVVLDFGPAGCAYLLSERPGEAIALGHLVDCMELGACRRLALPWWPVAHHVAVAKEDIDARDTFAGSDEPTGSGLGEEEKLKKENVLPFDWLAGLSRGDKLLGVLRMDVDHMGDLVAESLPTAATDADHSMDQLARFMAFSRQVDWFFSGYVDYLCAAEFAAAVLRAEEGPFASRLRDRGDKVTSCFYVAYSGGDDLFVVGPWSEMVELTQRIEESFGRCMCCNPALGVSAGLLVSKPKVPIYMLAGRAGSLEHASKDRGRGRVTLFGTTVRWTDRAGNEVSFEQARRLGEVLGRAAAGELPSADPASEGRSVPRGFLYLLLRLHERFGTGEHAGDKRYVPLLVWYLARTLARVNPEVPPDDWQAVVTDLPSNGQRGVRQLLQAILLMDPDRADAWMRRLRLPLSLALYLIRGDQRR